MRMVLVMAGALALSGCATVMGGGMQQYSVTDTMTLRAKPRNFVNTVEAVGTSLGYKIASLDAGANEVMLSNPSSGMSAALIGKFSQFQIYVSLNPDGRTVALRVMAMGNWKSADREKADKRLSDLKTALAARLN